MPSRFFDYESDLSNSTGRRERTPQKTGLRRLADSAKSRRTSSTERSSTSTARSSFSETANSGLLSVDWQPRHPPSRSAGALVTGNHNIREPSRDQQIEPTAQVQEWAHQMHMQQQRQYWWCTACHPKKPILQVPSDKALRKVRIAEPTHAYE